MSKACKWNSFDMNLVLTRDSKLIFQLCWVFIVVHKLLVAASGLSPVVALDGFFNCGAQASLIAEYRL